MALRRHHALHAPWVRAAHIHLRGQAIGPFGVASGASSGCTNTTGVIQNVHVSRRERPIPLAPPSLRSVEQKVAMTTS